MAFIARVALRNLKANIRGEQCCSLDECASGSLPYEVSWAGNQDLS